MLPSRSASFARCRSTAHAYRHLASAQATRRVLDHPWANTDDAFDKIKEKFSISGNETKEELFSKLKGAAQTVFPVEYEKHLEEKIKSKVLSQKNLGTDNGTAVSANILHKDDNPKTEEDMRKERLGSLLRKHTPWLNKK